MIDRRTKIALDAVKAQASRRLATEGFSPRGIQQRLDLGTDYVMRGVGACESPIEEIMVALLVFGDWHGFHEVTPVPVFLPTMDAPAPKGEILIVPQMQFMRYRADFGIVCRADGPLSSKLFFVECDGAAFHQDGMRDLVRDEYLAALGVTTIRATGSEINADPFAAAQRIIFAVTAWLDDLAEARAA